MRGHVTQRGKTWAYWVEAGRDINGKRKQLTKGGFVTKREAETALNATISKMTNGEYVEASRETMSEFMGRWLQTVNGDARPSTWAMWQSLIQRHIVPAVGHIEVQKLTTAQLNRLYGELLANGRCDGKGGLNPSTVRHVHATLRLALSMAVGEKLIGVSPTTGAKAPKKQGPKILTWSREEVQRFLASVGEDRLYAAYALALTTGLRRGELLGLAWRDVDLVTGSLSVRQILVSVNFRVIFSLPKTTASKRSVALDPLTVEMLQLHRLRQLKERDQLGLKAQRPDDLVFSSPAGEPLHPALFTDAFDRRVKTAGVRRIRLHDLRHTAATLMLSAGVHPKVVQERLGHGSIAVTMDLYSHMIPSLQTEAASKLGSLVLG